MYGSRHGLVEISLPTDIAHSKKLVENHNRELFSFKKQSRI